MKRSVHLHHAGSRAGIALLGGFVLAWGTTVPRAGAGGTTSPLPDIRVPVPRRAAGVVRATDYTRALARARKDGRDLVVLVHGSDWCRIGELFRRRVWESREFQHRLGNGFVLFEADVPEHPTPALKKKLAARQKGFSTRFGNYPDLVFIDPGGKRYAVITGYATMTRDGFPSSLSEAVHLLLSLRRAREVRDFCLEQARKASVSDKPKWLFRAWLAGADRRTTIVEMLDKADPDNHTGYPARVRFDGYGVLVKAKKFEDAGKFEEGLEWLRKQAATKGLTPEQKQWIYTALGNLYRRWPGHDREAFETFMKSERIEPHTIMGRAAHRLAWRFVGPPNLEFGWEPRHCTLQDTAWKIDAAQAISTPGDYRIAFVFRRGGSTLRIGSVTVYDGRRKVATLGGPAFVGPKHARAEFAFHLPHRLRKAVLRVRCHTLPKTDCTGDIRVEFLGRRSPRTGPARAGAR